jgi:hypothetical protein
MDKNILKKLKNIISKYDMYILFAFLLICSIGPSIYIELSAEDEIWNFHNILKLCNGLEIYKDANIIVTPLFFYIGVIFSKMFGATLLTFRIYNIMLISVLVLVVYKIFKTLKISKLKSLIYSLVIYISALYIGTAGANYNVLVVIFYLMGILISINESTFNSKIYNLLQGIIILLIFLTKQNIMVYYILGLILNELILSNKKYKLAIKSILIKCTIASILILTFLLIFQFKGQLNNFINYTILGIPEFSSNLSIDLELIGNLGVMFIIVLVALMTINYKNNSIDINSEMKTNITKLLIFGIFMTFISYPIFNIYHSLLSAYTIYILGFYLIDIIFVNRFKKAKEYLLLIIIMILIIISTYSIYTFMKYINFVRLNRCEDIEVYKNIIVKKKIREEILTVNKYIEDKEKEGIKVVIFSKYAAIYMVPLNKSNQDMDLPFFGNMGANGEKNMLKKITGLKNTELLIVKEEKNVSWQESKLIRKYIIDNFNCIGEIEIFRIYAL